MNLVLGYFLFSFAGCGRVGNHVRRLIFHTHQLVDFISTTASREIP